MMRVVSRLAAVVIAVAGAAFGLARGADGCGCPERVPGRINIVTACPTRWCLPRGYWPAPYVTPNYHPCTPLFFGGDPLAPDAPEPVTVIRLAPISNEPKEPPPYRPITAEATLPRRPLDI